MNENKHALNINWIDPDDAPELTDDLFARADEFIGDRLVRRGRPKAEITKQSLTVRYDQDVIQAFKATGKGWQSRMNEALRDWLKVHRMI